MRVGVLIESKGLPSELFYKDNRFTVKECLFCSRELIKNGSKVDLYKGRLTKDGKNFVTVRLYNHDAEWALKFH